MEPTQATLPDKRKTINDLPIAQRKHAAIERRREVWELKLSGLSNYKIAKLLGLSEPTVRWHLRKIHTKLEAETKMSAQAWREIELARIDAIVARLWPKRDDPRVADTVLRCMERRAKLLGLDAHEKVSVDMRRGDDLQTVQAKFDATKLTTSQLSQLESILQDALVPAESPQPTLAALPSPTDE